MKVYSPSVIENLNVSGSTSFTGSLTIDGTISASSGITGTATTASYVEFNNVDGLTTFSSSVDSRLVAQENFSSSLDTTFATDAELSAVSSSIDTRVGTAESDIDALEVRAGLLESATASLNTRVTDLESFSSSLDTTFATDAELSALSSSIDARIDNLDVEIGTLQAETSSYAVKASANTFTGNNTFTVSQSISDTTNSTAYTNGALTVAGGLGVGKDVNISGSLNVTGLLTAISMSTQYVTSSQYTIGVSRVIVNDDDLIRFAGLSVVDSGSTPYTGSLLWDSQRNHWIYENESGSAYNSAIIIAGPKNTGSLGDEVGLISGRIPVATGEDHIDTNTSLTPLRIDGGDFHVEDDMVVSGSVNATTFSGTFAGGVVSASSQIDHDATTNYSADEHFTQASITTVGTVTSGNVNAILPNGVVSGSTQFTNANDPFTGSFSGSFFGDGSNLSGVSSYTDTDTLNYINSLGVVSGSEQFTNASDPFTGSFSGSFFGDGSSLTNVSASYVTFNNVDGLSAFSSSVNTTLTNLDTRVTTIEDAVSEKILYTWGADLYGAMGTSDLLVKSSPVTVIGGITNWAKVFISEDASIYGYTRTFGITDTGLLYAWGKNTQGHLGTNDTTNKSSPVTVAGGITNWSQVSAGYNHSLAVTDTGVLYAWGSGGARLGTTDAAVSKSSPVTVVGGITNWIQIGAGVQDSVGLTSAGLIYSWGNNNNGQLGSNDTTPRSSPVTVAGGITNWSQVSLAGNHTLALTDTGVLYAWGRGSNGRLGDNTTTNKSSPVTVTGGITNWSQVSAGYNHSLAVTDTGVLYTWGNNNLGELGTNDRIYRSSPVTVVGGITNWSKINTGSNVSVAITDTGVLYSWGSNFSFSPRLGTNDTVNRSSPVTVAGGITSWSQVDVGGQHAMAIAVIL